MNMRAGTSFSAPAWVDEWLGDPVSRRSLCGAGWRGESLHGERFRRVRLIAPAAAALDDAALLRITRSLYAALRAALGDHPPIRIWNGVPGIVDPSATGGDRYREFNAGRHAAFIDWFGDDPERFAAAMPAATGVGITGEALVIDCLADALAGRAIENPRQVPAHRYSERYGRRPPCFSRATLIERSPVTQRPSLLISGTASIVGEDSQHAASAVAQLDETLTNLAALIDAAGGRGLTDIRHLRAYHLPQLDTGGPRERLSAQLPQASIEWQPVVLCRPELSVELEALARW